MFNLDERFREDPVTAVFAVLTIANADMADKRARKGEHIQREQAAVDRAQQASVAARERRTQVRKRLAAQASIQNVATQTGGAGGTAAVQSSAVAGTQAASNIGQINTTVASKNLQTSLQTDLFATQVPSGAERAAGIGANLAGLFAGKG